VSDAANQRFYFPSTLLSLRVLYGALAVKLAGGTFKPAPCPFVISVEHIFGQAGELGVWFD